MSDPISFGTAYYPDYYPEAEWERDLEKMRAAGLRTVRILEFAWCWIQPEPERWNWQPLDRFLDLASGKGLAVCLCTPTATPPPWFFQKYPDARLVNAKGEPCRTSRHMTCWNHSDARDEAWRTIEALATRYGSHPAVWGWQIDNEPNYAERVDEFYDFNPHFLADGRAWLREKYATLEALNTAWFAQFWSQAANDWEQIWATHHPRNNPHSHLDFLRWRDTSMARFVQGQAELLREHTSGQMIGCNIPEVGVKFSTAIGQDYWLQSRGLDWVGTDVYEASANLERDLASFRLNCDLMRSCAETARPGGAEFFIAETQGGPAERFWHSGFAPQYWDESYVKATAEVFAERGADAIWQFCWRPTPGGVELGMNGVQDFDGEDTPRTATIRAMAENPAPLADRRAAYEARPLALVHYSRDAFRFLSFFEKLDAVEASMRGVHRWLDEQGYRVTFLHDAELEERIADAELLVLAESPLMSTAMQRRVIEWSERGSRLVCGPHTALADERGQLLGRGGRLLHEWLGVKFGGWHDVGVKIERADGVIDSFRELVPADDAWSADRLTHDGREYPARVEVGSRATLYAYRWGALLGNTASTAPMPES